jgi:colicin import membrane protein
MCAWANLFSTGTAAAAAMAAGLLLAQAGVVQAQGTERQRIAAERLAVSAHYAQLEQACHGRFAVTACVEDVQARRREALAPLRERELRLDEADRLERAEQRRAAVLAKQQAALARPAPQVPAALAPRLREAPAGPAGAPSTTRAERGPQGSAARASEAAARVQAAQQRRQAAQGTQDRIARREAERLQSGRRAPPLPEPTASAAAR